MIACVCDLPVPHLQDSRMHSDDNRYKWVWWGLSLLCTIWVHVTIYEGHAFASSHLHMLPTRKRKDKRGAYATHQQYLCVWHALNSTEIFFIKKWIDEQHILDKVNLAYEHNLTLVHKFLKTKCNTDALGKHPKEFYTPKQKTWDLLAPHLTLNTQEYNMDKAIHPQNPTI